MFKSFIKSMFLTDFLDLCHHLSGLPTVYRVTSFWFPSMGLMTSDRFVLPSHIEAGHAADRPNF